MRRWNFELNCAAQRGGKQVDALGSLRSVTETDAPGRSTPAGAAEERKKLQMKYARAKDIGLSPAKNLLMTAFMLWMSGSGLNIFTILFTAMALWNPIKSILAVNQAFESLNDGTMHLLPYKGLYVLTNVLGVAMAMYKCKSMGLLPLYSSDWVSLLPIPTPAEVSVPAFVV